MGLKSLNCSFWHFFMGNTKIRYKAILHQHYNENKAFLKER
ncbi:hypothetical protein HPHPA14_0857 [Helicobacter pylori Hp A-14]|nr:hypothetical protein HPHPA14_0857 [Helicobacter pylori Hp A-14]